MKINAVRIPALALALAVSACEQPGHPYHGPSPSYGASMPQGAGGTLSTNATTYLPGATVTIRLTSRWNAPFGYNLCRAVLERNNDDDWHPARPTLSDACTAEVRTLHPGQTAVFSFQLDRELRRGTYRVRLPDPAMRQGFVAISNSFQLQGNESD